MSSEQARQQRADPRGRVLGGELGISAIPSSGFNKIGYLVLVLTLAALVAAFSLWIKRSWMGFAFDAVADDEDTARVVTVDVSAYKLAAFAMGTAMACFRWWPWVGSDLYSA